MVIVAYLRINKIFLTFADISCLSVDEIRLVT